MLRFPQTPDCLAVFLCLACAGGAFTQPAALPLGGSDGTAPGEKFAPFDLKYMVIEGPGMAGFRPAEIAKRLPAGKVPPEYQCLLRFFMAQMLSLSFDCDTAAAEPPGIENIDQCVCRLSASVVLPSADKQGTFVGGLGTPFVVRTVQPFDWAGLMQKWFPRAEKKRHEGRDYVRTALKPDVVAKLPKERLPEGDLYVAVFVPDNRTVVFGFEGEIKTLLHRLQTGEPGPAPPPGWEEFERDLIAVVRDTREAPLVYGEWPTDPPDMTNSRTVIECTEVFAAGLRIGDGTGLRVTALAKDSQAAGKVAAATRQLLSAARAALGEEAKGQELQKLVKLLDGALDRAEVTERGRHVRLHVGVACNLAGVLATIPQESPKTPAPVPTKDASKPADNTPGGHQAEERGTPEKTANPPGLTLANFNKITDGMTMEQVEALLGPPYHRWAVAGGVTCKWFGGPDSVFVTVRFEQAPCFPNPKRAAYLYPTRWPTRFRSG
jgi:hypothetical protein